MTPEELLALDAAPSAAAGGQPPVPKAGHEFTPQDLEALDAAPSGTAAQPAQQQANLPAPTVETPQAQPAAAPAVPAPEAPAPQAGPTAPGDGSSTDWRDASHYDAAGRVGGAILTGAAKSIFETKDFIFGKPDPGITSLVTGDKDAGKSQTRRDIERLDKSLGEASIGNSFVSGLSQFATGMLGAGKVVGLLKGVRGIGAGIEALEATKKGAWALSSAKAATVGAVAIDPNGPRLSDLVQQFPALQNPVNAYLANHPGDSETIGRMKNALESIGVDIALAGVFTASVAGFRALRSGDRAAIEATQSELAHAVAHKDAKLAYSKGDLDEVERLRESHPEAVAQAEPALPTQRPVNADPTEGSAGAEGPSKINDLQNQGVSGAQPRALDTPGQSISGPADTAAQRASPRAIPLDITTDQLTRLIEHGQADTQAILGPGGWEGALERGYRFGDGGSIPWQKFWRPGDGPQPLDFMIRRVADELSAPLAAIKGGDAEGVLHDAQVERMVGQRVALWNEDPEALLGLLQQAGSQARTMSVNMEAGFLVGQRVMQDALNLRSRIGLGMLEEFGGDLGAAREALQQQLEVASTAFGQAQSMRASAGRALRRNRADFQLQPDDIAAMRGLDDAKFFNLLDAVGHDFQVANRLVKPGLWARIKDDASYLYVNNLLWGLRTHFVNLSTNSYMLMGRPLERMIGYGAQGDLRGVQENWSQYGYMGASLMDSFRDAVRTWKTGDSVLSPHSVEVNPAGIADAGRGTNWVAEGFKPWDSVPNVVANAYTGFMKGAGLPTRALGAVDELVKQVVYRSKVQAAALSDGIGAGLDGEALTAHVRSKLLAAYDDAGRAVDMKALDEANIATFQQDLLEGTWGKTVQNTVASQQVLRFVLPFVRTPTNVIRMGVKLTPGLNMLQGEYRQMIRGQMGPEKQAQAMGQMAMGSLFLGSASFLAMQGYITGGGPTDARLNAELKATGWQPYSFVTANADGSKTYVNFGRYDPIAMPFGIVADIVDILSRDQDGDGQGERAVQAASGLVIALAKQMGQKSYLTSLHDTLDAIMDPDKNASKVIGSMAANFVPGASALRFYSPDPYLREARTIVDKIAATVPGLAEKLPPKRDVFGDPLTVHKGLWVDGEKTAVDAEVRRMVEEEGVGPFGPPSPRYRDVDLRNVTMKDGRNAYDALQELAGHPPRGPSLKEMVGRIMATKAYQHAPDGDPGNHQKGTKQAMFTGTVAKYREVASRLLMRDENVRQAVVKQSLKARAAYAVKSAPKTDQQAGAASLVQMGKAVGVDLGGLLPE
ncbi:hypothetical protein HCU64_14200 [Methylobacterium sp. C25]|uniref:hypothetical protein n=1 Tax=Methylobacterium sp. C25 TaxID=2721622 RepID=UPI001F31AC7F|nr:hypothetical protein [Methylobacterium sp. C25]MCE4224911.1 hypothetical protein [Methylobacterium sp. C25]